MVEDVPVSFEGFSENAHRMFSESMGTNQNVLVLLNKNPQTPSAVSSAHTAELIFV